MFSQADYDQIARATVVTSDGESLGTVDTLYVDDTSDQPTWVTVHTGLLGLRTHLVPLEGARLEGDQLFVPYTKDQIKDAPSMDEGGHLSPEDEAQLYAHYGRGDHQAGTDPRMRRYGDAAGVGAAGAGGAAGGLLDSDRDGRGPVDEVRDGPDRGGMFDRDADGRGPVEEVLDGPDALRDERVGDRDRGYDRAAEADRRYDGSYDGDVRGDVRDDLRGDRVGDPIFDRDRDGRGPVDEVRDGPDRGGMFDRDADGRGPVEEVLDGPDALRDDRTYDRGYEEDPLRPDLDRGGNPPYDEAGRPLPDEDRGSFLDSDADGRGPVEEVLDGPDDEFGWARDQR